MSESKMLDDSGNEWKVVGPLAYQGKEGCTSITCTRIGIDTGASRCVGWHCSYCGAPCSSQGHGCDAANALLAESARAASEDRP